MDSPESADIHRKGFCMACGYNGPNYRCHITARVNGGSDAVDNLHMLCKTCHDASEYLQGEAYWRWFGRQSPFTTAPIILARRGISTEKMAGLSLEQQHKALEILTQVGIDRLVEHCTAVGIDLELV